MSMEYERSRKRTLTPYTHTARLAFVEEIKQVQEEYYYVESGFTVNNDPMYKRVRK